MTANEEDGALTHRIATAFKPSRVGVALAGLVSFSIMVGMFVAHNRLIEAGVVGTTEGAEVLAIPGTGFGVLGLLLISGALIHAKVIDDA